MNCKLACADFAFPLLPHEAALQLISMMGIKGVDIGLFENRSHLWPSREFQDIDTSAKTLKKTLDDLELIPADIFLQVDLDFKDYAINHPDATRRSQARDCFHKTLEYTAICQCDHITILPGVSFESESYADSFNRCRDEFSWRLEQAKPYGITLGTEAHIGSLVPKPEQAEALIQAVPGLTLSLDYTHFTQAGLPDADVEPLIQYASHFHARGARKGRLQTSFKENSIDYQRVLEAMEAAQYDGWIGIEYTWIDWEHCNECDNVSETMQFLNFFNLANK